MFKLIRYFSVTSAIAIIAIAILIALDGYFCLPLEAGEYSLSRIVAQYGLDFQKCSIDLPDNTFLVEKGEAVYLGNLKIGVRAMRQRYRPPWLFLREYEGRDMLNEALPGLQRRFTRLSSVETRKDICWGVVGESGSDFDGDTHLIAYYSVGRAQAFDAHLAHSCVSYESPSSSRPPR